MIVLSRILRIRSALVRQLLEAVQSSGLHMWGNLKSVTAFVLSREKRVVAVLGANTLGLVELFPSRVLKESLLGAGDS